MPDITVTAAVDKISDYLRALNAETIKGAILGETIRKIAPELNIREVTNTPTGPGALSKFIGRFLSPLLTRDGESGSDPIYRINHSTKKIGANEGMLWLTFARPGAEKVISLDISDGLDNATVSVDEALPPNHQPIPSATHTELNKIRHDFTADVNKKKEEGQSDLDPDVQYSEWAKSLNLISPLHYKKWPAYRINGIVELFHGRLEKLNIPLHRSKILEDELRRSQKQGRDEAKSQRISTPTAEKTFEISPQHASDRLSALRATIVDALNNLSEEELRQIRLPAGAMFDAFYSSFHRK